MRRFLPAILALFLLCTTASAVHAQISVYGTFSDNRVSNVINGNTFGLNPQYTYGSYWDPGFGGGLTVTMLPLGPVSLGLDLRGSSRAGTPGDDTALAGLKLGARIPLLALKPYIQASGGYLRTRTPATINLAPATATRGFAVYEILGGLDAPLLPHLDLRLIEIGGGQGSQISGPNSNGTNVSLLTINTGLVLHF